jgi:tetratricopeptide (TPR) repeat protein
MDLKVVSGKTIELPAEFFSGDEPTDPASPRVEIVDPNGVVVVSNGVPVRNRKGIYRYNYPVPAGAPTGAWKAVWSATIDGAEVSASDLFEVQPPPGAPGPANAPGAKAAGTKAAGAKAAEAKTAHSGQPMPAKPAETKPAETKPAETKPAEASKPKPAAAPAKSAGRAPETNQAAKPQASGKDPKSRRRGRQGSEPRSRLSRGKALLIVAGLAIVFAAIWFSPRRGDSVQAKIDQGVAAQKAGRTEEAQKLYEEVLQNDPGNKLANYNLGVAAHIASDTKKAESFYLKSLQTDPEFLPALFNLAILQENTGRNDESAKTYRRLLEKYPDNGPGHLNYGFLLVQKLNKPEEGRAEFKRAVEVSPGLAARIPAEFRPAPAPAP